MGTARINETILCLGDCDWLVDVTAIKFRDEDRNASMKRSIRGAGISAAVLFTEKTGKLARESVGKRRNENGNETRGYVARANRSSFIRVTVIRRMTKPGDEGGDIKSWDYRERLEAVRGARRN